jgi:hypothetical protein
MRTDTNEVFAAFHVSPTRIFTSKKPPTALDGSTRQRKKASKSRNLYSFHSLTPSDRRVRRHGWVQKLLIVASILKSKSNETPPRDFTIGKPKILSIYHIASHTPCCARCINLPDDGQTIHPEPYDRGRSLGPTVQRPHLHDMCMSLCPLPASIFASFRLRSR